MIVFKKKIDDRVNNRIMEIDTDGAELGTRSDFDPLSEDTF